MGFDKPPNRLLIVDEDARLAETLTQHFEVEGYQVFGAGTGKDALTLAVNARPDLILLSARLPDMAGLDVFRALRDKPRTAHIPVMVLAGPSETVLQHKVLEEGAYDFIEKPLDLDILTLRVRNALRRAEREGLTEPRTGLPSGRLLQERIRTLADEQGWYRIDLTIDHFNVFRDLYGFVTANEALRFAGNLIAQIVNEQGGIDDFVGHAANTEEFLIITTLARGPELSKVLAQRVTQELQSFYNFTERDQGFVLVEDGAGGKAQKPLMSAQVKTTQGPAAANLPASPTPNSTDDPWVDAVNGSSGASGDSPFEW